MARASRPSAAGRSKVRRSPHHPALAYAEMPPFMERAPSPRWNRATRPRVHDPHGQQDRRGDGCALGGDRPCLELWIIPSERMKSGTEHRVPLSPRALAIVKEMAEIRLSEFVFPGVKQGRPLSDMGARTLVRELHEGITRHGFRSTFRDWAAETHKLPQPRRRDGLGTCGGRRGRGRLSARRSAREAPQADGGVGSALRSPSENS